MKLKELLAPAGSFEVFIVAINTGANAVYLSGHRYGARAFAHNFTSEELEKAVEYAHLNGATVHVTVNTLINNFEIISVLKYLHYLYRIGVDAVIIQDLGVVNLAHKFIPKLEIHSSTQMTLRDYESIKWASKQGMSRVILPREMSVKEISRISKRLKEDNIPMDLEVFGHGSLCYCLSGKCYISSFNNGRSANRGACSQPCRNNYRLRYNNHTISSGCLISTHDLATYNDLKSISDAGVCSLKIEGRLKNADYVGTIVHSYRTMLDILEKREKMEKEGNNAPIIINGKSENEIIEELKYDLDLAFNRYYTNGYILDDAPGDVMGRESSYHQGIYVGVITDIEGELITIDTSKKQHPIKLQNGDGIGFKYHNKIKGIYIDNIIKQTNNEIQLNTTRDIRVGSEVYLSYSKEAHDKLKKYTKEQVNPSYPISLDLKINEDNLLEANAEFKVQNDIVNFNYTSTEKFEKAIKKPITSEKIIKQMSKTGNTPFYIKKINIEEIKDDLFIPMSKLNEIRREILNKATELMLDYYIPDEKEVKTIKKSIKKYGKDYKERGKFIAATESNFDTNYDKYIGLSVYVDNLDLLREVCKHPILRVYYDPSFNYKNSKDYFNNINKELSKAYEIANGVELVWVLSSFISEKDIAKSNDVVNSLKRKGINISVMTDSPGISNIFDCPVYGHHNLNIWNSYSVETLCESGFNGLTLSNELSKDEIKELTLRNKKDIPLKLLVHGNLELMTSKDNFTKLNGDKKLKLKNNKDYVTLEDKKRKLKIKIRFDYNNFSHFFNQNCLCLIDEIDTIKNIGLDTIALDCRFSSEKYVSKIISLYIQAINKESEGETLKETISSISQSPLDNGNFIDGRRLEDKNY
ncbi:peptidase [Methanobrevibacter sp. 87.7]|uniref:U32 family peptidase n=1 Tax=Methanobrevibacter sp. 87.7 TaxID=387957 RepID=UPI000B50CD67|nr:U32 family peptidase [Methanobrevibacter sp. 87.7]OWT33218.1 peptidase [Methanobrevibacter sp. 87.7]